MLLPQPPEFEDYRHAPLHPAGLLQIGKILENFRYHIVTSVPETPENLCSNLKDLKLSEDRGHSVPDGFIPCHLSVKYCGRFCPQVLTISISGENSSKSLGGTRALF